MDETLAQELLKDLRATQARLEAAHEDIAALKVLLTLRTHQHDLAWQAAQRLEGELAAARAAQEPTVENPVAAVPADETARAEAAEALAASQERFEAARIVLGAVLDCIGRRALDRRRFQDLVAKAGRETPDHGPGAARHAVLLAEARRVLGAAG